MNVLIISENGLSVKFLGISISEFGTFISDLIMGLSFLCFYFYLNKISVNKQQKWISCFYLFLALSSIFGAFGHGFFDYFENPMRILSWLCAGTAAYCILYGSSNMITNKNLKIIYNYFNGIQLFVFAGFILINPVFIIVKISLAFSLIGILIPLYIVDTIKNSNTANIYIFAGIFIACIPALFHTIDFRFGYIFNMNDLSHFILIGCVYLTFIGLRKRHWRTEKNKSLK
jgi:hypothetical protein